MSISSSTVQLKPMSVIDIYKVHSEGYQITKICKTKVLKIGQVWVGGDELSKPMSESYVFGPNSLYFPYLGKAKVLKRHFALSTD